MTKDSISIVLVRQALHAVSPQQATLVLFEAGIAHSSLLDDDAHVPTATYARLWAALANALDDEFFNMAPRPLRAGSLAHLWRAATGQASVQAGLCLALEFLRLMLGMSAQLEQQRSVAVITLETPDTQAEPVRPFTCFTFWMIAHGLTCWLSGRRVPILAVELRSGTPRHTADYQRFFGANLRFDQPFTRLVFPADCLTLPVRRSAYDLDTFCQRLPGNLLVKYRDPSGFAQRIREHLKNTPLTAWPEASALAAEYGVSVATLRRRLAAQGVNLQHLKASLRKERAVTWLAERDDNIAAIAEQLGFADERSFYRAFRQWFDAKPGDYRSLVRGTGKNAQAD